MEAENILLLGVKGTVIAFRRDTGAELWRTHLKSSDFVTIASDAFRVYAHTGGELFCLDLQTGGRAWHNDLPGLGYGVASLALPDVSGSTDVLFEKKRQADAAAAAATTSSASR